jgi:hypothetical protein
MNRAAERGITRAEMIAALDTPEVTYQQHTYGPHRQVRQRGRVSVVVNTETKEVITALYRFNEIWLNHLTDRSAA